MRRLRKFLRILFSPLRPRRRGWDRVETRPMNGNPGAVNAKFVIWVRK